MKFLMPRKKLIIKQKLVSIIILITISSINVQILISYFYLHHVICLGFFFLFQLLFWCHPPLFSWIAKFIVTFLSCCTWPISWGLAWILENIVHGSFKEFWKVSVFNLIRYCFFFHLTVFLSQLFTKII